MRRVEGVLLDLDDTLIDTRAAFRSAIGYLLDKWIPGLDDATREAGVRYWAVDPNGYFAAYTRGEYDQFTMRSLRAADLHATFGGPALTPDGLQEWVADFRRELDAAWTATAEASDAVDELLRLGYRLGAVTNARRDEQQAKLDRLGLADRVPLLACLDDLGRGKPDPRIWHLACERFGVPPARSAYVGDELDVDARGAVAAGLLGVWLDRHATGERPGDVAVITDLRQLPAVLGPGPAPAPGPGPDPI